MFVLRVCKYESKVLTTFLINHDEGREGNFNYQFDNYNCARFSLMLFKHATVPKHGFMPAGQSYRHDLAIISIGHAPMDVKIGFNEFYK